MNRMSGRAMGAWLCALTIGLWPAWAAAQARDLTAVSLEELMDMEVRTASGFSDRLGDTPAAIYVITADEIRRSGLTTVPELLRLAPGVQVSRIDSNKWAVSIRGFNTRWSNKLLVLIDGRSVYDRMFSGVYWNALDVSTDDIERIEIIRGPGATVWGTNAVNGVVNIITKAPIDTQGAAVRVGGGSTGATDSYLRYGGTAGSAAFRAHLLWSDLGSSTYADGQEATDGGRTLSGGARAEWRGSVHRLTVQGDVGSGRAESAAPRWTGPIPPAGGWPVIPSTATWTRANVLGRWTFTPGDGRVLEVQPFVDIVDRNDPYIQVSTATVDVDARYRHPLGRRHRITMGAGVRRIADDTGGGYGFRFDPVSDRRVIAHGFIEDEIGFIDGRLKVMLGAKVEHGAGTSAGFQPTARIQWRIADNQQIWGGVSRALRGPARTDRGLEFDVSVANPTGLPTVLAFRGDAAFAPERVISTEVGYRVDLGRVTIDSTAFYSRYADLGVHVAGVPTVQRAAGQPYLMIPLTMTNVLDASTHGVETSVRWTANEAFHVDAGYSYFHADPDPAAEAALVDTTSLDGNVPRHQFQVRPALDLGRRVSLDSAVFFTGGIERAGKQEAVRADVRLGWQMWPGWSLELTGQDLFTHRRIEFENENTTPPTVVGRRFDVRLRWGF